MWPGNTTDVKTLIPVIDKLQKRFSINSVSVVADRGMISEETIKALSDKKRNIPYILGTRMRKVKEIKEIIESHIDIDTFTEVYAVIVSYLFT